MICEYLEEQHPKPALIGTTPEERAETRMWTRRAVLNVIEPMSNGFRFKEALPMFKDRMRTIPHAADDLKAVAQDGLAALRPGARRPAAGSPARASRSPTSRSTACSTSSPESASRSTRSSTNVGAWFQRVGARPSADASIHPNAKAAKMRA